MLHRNNKMLNEIDQALARIEAGAFCFYEDTGEPIGIERVYVGHTVVDEVLDLGNVRYLDMGDCFDNSRLTLVEIGGSKAIFSVEKICSSGKVPLEAQ